MLPMKGEVHAGGMFAATGLAALASAGARMTSLRGVHGADALWLTLFTAAWLLMSAAAVNFDAKRWLW